MKSKYPFILAHGIVLKDVKFFKAFGRLEKELKKEGYSVYTGKTDGFGAIETNAAQLKAHIEKILAHERVEKVNIIAHSKGGLDAKYMIEHLGMEDKVASLTTLCTPHKGSPIASNILNYPFWFVKFLAFWLNFFYRIFGDEKPDAFTVCKQLQKVSDIKTDTLNFSDKVYCQSYSSILQKEYGNFLSGIPFNYSEYFEGELSDGLVSVESSKFGIYRGNCLEESVSHSETVGFMTKKKKKEKIFSFYIQLCNELTQKGF